ncbi:protein spinster-like [Cucumis melo var. makuwa]|uniref:Protein spinster-like n=1 Tax=Cucumis melo var. makuwa TaxID=1194695 RepID=A0A5D3CU26_CUCMM|nr:protein spinster-like [Cucumis melo var. makuwa]TYK13699.1 protein spinster-like [Cucumis melo var. makuwa]
MNRNRKIYGVSISLILINLAAIMERADENLLPSVYKEVSETFNASPSDLGYLTFIRNFVQGLCSPLAGILVLSYDRPKVLAMGTFCWALSTAAVGICLEFKQVAFWRAVNGFGLAIVIPALQSFIADSYMDGVRGMGFGLLSLIGSLGGIGGGVLATVMAGQQYFGVEGWRCAFILMATLSAIIGILVYMFVVDPRKTINHIQESSDRDNLIDRTLPNSSSIWFESWTAMKAVMKVHTFQIIVLQGIVGSLPWTAMVFFTMWFELIGFSHNGTAVLLSLFAVGCALGCLLGGLIADRLSKIYPHSGRIMCAQFSASMGIPFSLLLLRLIPQSVDSLLIFGVTLFLMGLTISWNGTAVNAPIFAEVVPIKHRTMIYAFDRAFEGSFSSFAAPLVGILSEKMFGYDDTAGASILKALALSKGLLTMMTVPFGICCLCYTPLYKYFRLDRENARMQGSKGSKSIDDL